MTIVFNNRVPYVEGINLNELVKITPTPFYIYSQKSIEDAYAEIKNKLKKKIFYSIKANSNQAIIAFINSLGAGADVVSVEEMERALAAGIEPNKIIYEGVGKSQSDIINAIQKNIRQINVESLEELLQINTIGKNLNKKVNIGLRLNPDIDGNTHDKISTGRKTDKFGIDFNQLTKICPLIKSFNNIKLKGISCHIGSQIFELQIFKNTFIKMKKGLEILNSYGLTIEHLNLGGGFGISYDDTKNNFNFNDLADLINNIFPSPNFEISFEPGRYLVAKAGILITKIITTKYNNKTNYLITDAGMQTLLRPALYDAFHKIIPLSQNNIKINYTIAGPICESSDVFSKNIILSEQKTGNYLAICDVGAYGSVMASNYNSKCLPAEIMICNKKYSIIRQQENISSLIQKDIIPKWIKN